MTDTKTVKRYHLSDSQAELTESPLGDLLFYSDFDALRLELEAARHVCTRYTARITELVSERDLAHDAAVEECAVLLDDNARSYGAIDQLRTLAQRTRDYAAEKLLLNASEQIRKLKRGGK